MYIYISYSIDDNNHADSHIWNHVSTLISVGIHIYIYIESGLRIPGPPPMVWSPKLTLSGTRDTGPYIHTCIHPSIRTYIHKYIHTHTQTDIHTYLPTYLHTYIPTYLRTHVHTYIPTYIPTYLHTYIDTNIPTYIPTYKHTTTTGHRGGTRRTIPPPQATGGGPEEPYHHPRPQGGGPWGGTMGGEGGAWESWVIYINYRLSDMFIQCVWYLSGNQTWLAKQNPWYRYNPLIGYPHSKNGTNNPLPNWDMHIQAPFHTWKDSTTLQTIITKVPRVSLAQRFSHL